MHSTRTWQDASVDVLLLFHCIILVLLCSLAILCHRNSEVWQVSENPIVFKFVVLQVTYFIAYSVISGADPEISQRECLNPQLWKPKVEGSGGQGFFLFLMPNINGLYLGLNTHLTSHLWITSPLPYQLSQRVFNARASTFWCTQALFKYLTSYKKIN